CFTLKENISRRTAGSCRVPRRALARRSLVFIRRNILRRPFSYAWHRKVVRLFRAERPSFLLAMASIAGTQFPPVVGSPFSEVTDFIGENRPTMMKPFGNWSGCATPDRVSSSSPGSPSGGWTTTRNSTITYGQDSNVSRRIIVSSRSIFAARTLRVRNYLQNRNREFSSIKICLVLGIVAKSVRCRPTASPGVKRQVFQAQHSDPYPVPLRCDQSDRGPKEADSLVHTVRSPRKEKRHDNHSVQGPDRPRQVFRRRHKEMQKLQQASVAVLPKCSWTGSILLVARWAKVRKTTGASHHAIGRTRLQIQAGAVPPMCTSAPAAPHRYRTS